MSDGSIDWHVEQAIKQRKLRDDLAEFLFKGNYQHLDSYEIADLLLSGFDLHRLATSRVSSDDGGGRGN